MTRDHANPQSQSKRRLLEVAETLFAQHGFEVVSIRDITKVANASNAAINYHFGSRDGLIAMVVARYMGPIHEERMAMLDVLERRAGSRPVPLEQLLEVLVKPLAAVTRKSELSDRLFYQLLGRIIAWSEQGGHPTVDEQIRVFRQRFRKALAKHFPEQSEATLAWKLHFVCGSLIHALVHQPTLSRPAAAGVESVPIELVLEQVTAFAVAGLRSGAGGDANDSPGAQVMFDF